MTPPRQMTAEERRQGIFEMWDERPQTLVPLIDAAILAAEADARRPLEERIAELEANQSERAREQSIGANLPANWLEKQQ